MVSRLPRRHPAQPQVLAQTATRSTAGAPLADPDPGASAPVQTVARSPVHCRSDHSPNWRASMPIATSRPLSWPCASSGPPAATTARPDQYSQQLGGPARRTASARTPKHARFSASPPPVPSPHTLLPMPSPVSLRICRNAMCFARIGYPGQLVHPQAEAGHVAAAAPERASPLHPDPRILAEPDRDLVLDPGRDIAERRLIMPVPSSGPRAPSIRSASSLVLPANDFGYLMFAISSSRHSKFLACPSSCSAGRHWARQEARS